MFKSTNRILFQKLGSEAVLLNLENEEYYGLDKVGCRMWEVLMEVKTIESALSILLMEYDIDKDILRRDLLKLISNLKTEKLIEDAE